MVENPISGRRELSSTEQEIDQPLLTVMEILIMLIKGLIALSILNVWLVRREKVSRWRGGDALNLKDES